MARFPGCSKSLEMIRKSDTYGKMDTKVGRPSVSEFSAHAHFRGEEPGPAQIESGAGTAASHIGIHQWIGSAYSDIADDAFAEQVKSVGNRIAETYHRSDQERGDGRVIGLEFVNAEAEVCACREGHLFAKGEEGIVGVHLNGGKNQRVATAAGGSKADACIDRETANVAMSGLRCDGVNAKDKEDGEGNKLFHNVLILKGYMLMPVVFDDDYGLFKAPDS